MHSSWMINASKLLMLSGIGDPEELSEFGSGTQVPLLQVGKNLQDHHEVPVFPTSRSDPGHFGEYRWLKLLVNDRQYMLFRSDLNSMIGVQATALVMLDETGDPVLQMSCIPSVNLDRDIVDVKPTPAVTINALLPSPRHADGPRCDQATCVTCLSSIRFPGSPRRSGA